MIGAPAIAAPGDVLLTELLRLYVTAMEVRHFAPSTVETQQMLMRWFIAYAAERDIRHAAAVTRDLVDRYQRHLFTLRVKIGAPARTHPSPALAQPGPHTPQGAALRPLSVRGQHGRLWAVVRFFRWCVRVGHLVHSPAAVVEMPRLPRLLPRPALTVAEVERILAVPDIATANGLRDRAILEVLYATGIRRGELVALLVDDIDRDRGVVRITQGKGRKGRIVPISLRALSWLDRYLASVWSTMPQALMHRRLFISVDDAKSRHRGHPLTGSTVSRVMGTYLTVSGVTKPGACHIFRHTAATLMMENGADIRAIQDFLGHSEIKTTGIYTNVSFQFLKTQHAKTHPSAFQGMGPDQAADAAGADAGDSAQGPG